jgi:hypothetical protein
MPAKEASGPLSVGSDGFFSQIFKRIGSCRRDPLSLFAQAELKPFRVLGLAGPKWVFRV